MNKIEFHSVIPNVFSSATSLKSELWGKDVTFEKGQSYLLEADSGKGKSTFCSYIIGYRHDYQGRIMMDSLEAASLKVRDWVEVRKNKISYLFQELRLFPELTALENVEIKNRLTHHKTLEEITRWFKALGILDKINEKASHLSFGQQQRVAMIRALVQPFDFLIMDEPISHLDEGNSSIMAEIMIEEVKKQGASLIATSIGKHMDLNYQNHIKL